VLPNILLPVPSLAKGLAIDAVGDLAAAEKWETDWSLDEVCERPFFGFSDFSFWSVMKLDIAAPSSYFYCIFVR
jgi:hypothetical protein